jgi:hypothetical protein
LLKLRRFFSKDYKEQSIKPFIAAIKLVDNLDFALVAFDFASEAFDFALTFRDLVIPNLDQFAAAFAIAFNQN